MATRRFLGAILAVGVVCLAAAGPAGASSTGEIKRAEATADWSHGSFAGSVTWSDCNAGCLNWHILIYAEPTSGYTCEVTDYLEVGEPNVKQVWDSGEQKGNKTISFDVGETPLIPGVVGQQLCVLGLQQTTTGYQPQLITKANFTARPAAPGETGKPGGVSSRCKAARSSVKQLKKRLAAAKDAGDAKKLRKLNRALKKALAKRASAC
jgi:hypothetical protein